VDADVLLFHRLPIPKRAPATTNTCDLAAGGSCDDRLGEIALAVAQDAGRLGEDAN
jgi:hypothetical protein